MGLTSFLKAQGFIKDEPADEVNEQNDNSGSNEEPDNKVTPTFFPVEPASAPSSSASSSDPSFVSPLKQGAPQDTAEKDHLDPTFVKFFEDELVKANLPGPDYFEFRQSLMKTQQKMAATGVAAPDVILQAVLMTFEAQDVSRAKLKESALHYKEILKQKSEGFLKGAAAEKSNQLQKRQAALQAHNDSIKKMQQQLEQLEIQKQQLTQTMAKEINQLDVDKTLGQEGIQKIEKAEQLLTYAYNHIQASIDNDITRL
jgi:hypothetical protein